MPDWLKKLAKIQLSNSPNKQTEYKRTLFYEMKNMGGVYFKCLQILAVNNKFLEGWAGPAEMTVFNQIPTETIDVSQHIDVSAFSHYGTEPFATGSFAQAYKGRLKTGETVAIKILRPSISNHLDQDLRYLRRLAGLFTKFIVSPIVNYQDVIDEFCKTCVLETDYSREIANMEYFHKFYQGHPLVVIPKAYRSLSSSNVIVQDFIDGPTFADVLSATVNQPATEIAKRMTGSDLWSQLAVAGGEALRMAMQANYVFGDPHPGNIKLLPNNKIAFIDFGIIANKPISQAAFRDWVKAYRNILDGSGGLHKLIETTLMCFSPDFATALNNCSFDAAQPVLSVLAEAVTSKFDNMKDDRAVRDLADNGHFFRLLTEVLDGGNALNVRLDMSGFQLLKAMQSFLGSLTVLDDRETRDKFASAMLAAMNYALSYAEAYGVKNDMPTKSRFSLGESYELLLETFSSLAESDQFIFERVSGRMLI